MHLSLLLFLWLSGLNDSRVCLMSSDQARQRVISDKWAAYAVIRYLPNMNYQHGKVNHSVESVSAADATVHTQGIEGF